MGDQQPAPALDSHHLVFQPIIARPFAGTPRIEYWEVLSRCIDAGISGVPQALLQDPQATGRIDRATLEKVAPWARENDGRFGVNVAASTLLEPLYLRQLDRLLEQGVDPRKLVIELTETFDLDRIPPLVDALEALRERRVGVALDDFGTGGAGLSIFTLFDFDYVKVSPWVDTTTSRGRAMFEALMAMSTDLAPRHGFQIILEGVEDADMLAHADAFQVHCVQGFHLGRPSLHPKVPAAIESLDVAPVWL
ncbi:EAL domain-containing protein [Thioalkalivibrio sp. K90mix]|uniref:EAL domain-containing protein n=1 Tax=Thioalkalivibrio sp. (strain K90mix) TaxID=396595 RepID=UPI000195A8C1|nr:EAL domain-containing protein [Thioalkalivibrio sp. K90mix]